MNYLNLFGLSLTKAYIRRHISVARLPLKLSSISETDEAWWHESDNLSGDPYQDLTRYHYHDDNKEHLATGKKKYPVLPGQVEKTKARFCVPAQELPEQDRIRRYVVRNQRRPDRAAW